MSQSKNSVSSGFKQLGLVLLALTVIIAVKTGINKDIDFENSDSVLSALISLPKTVYNYLIRVNDGEILSSILFKSQIHWGFLGTIAILVVGLIASFLGFKWSNVPKDPFVYVINSAILLVGTFIVLAIGAKYCNFLDKSNIDSASIYLDNFLPKSKFQKGIAILWFSLFSIPFLENKLGLLIEKMVYLIIPKDQEKNAIIVSIAVFSLILAVGISIVL